MKRALFFIVFAIAPLGACDPVRDDAITALGDEAPGVPRGPLHRPGQPCVLCHDGNLGNPPGFSVAGTVYTTATGTDPAADVFVDLTDSRGTLFTAQTNAAGNFFVLPHQFQPVYPMKVAMRYGNQAVKMVANVGRNGSCAVCHSDPTSPSSAGHVYAPADGVTP